MYSLFKKTCLIALVSSLYCNVARSQTIDLLFVDWHSVAPRTSDGLQERDILTPGNPNSPAHKGAVLRFLKSYTCASLGPGLSTKPTTLVQEQKVLFFTDGSGVIVSAGEQQKVAKNTVVLIPPGLEYSIKNTSGDALVMYTLAEPTLDGFRANAKILVKDEGTLPIDKPDERWSYMVKTLLTKSDGLSMLESVSTVVLSSMTMGRPTVRNSDTEEVWTSLQGTTLAFIGNQLRRQTPGMTYLAPVDGETPHANINPDKEGQAKFLSFRLVSTARSAQR
jgi:mannose-6-phosphate isomerase-like protein (cupin superfamily)